MQNKLTEQISGVPGIESFPLPQGARNVYWKYFLLVDPEVIPDGAVSGLGGT
jgi:hypothetical protein